jgi:acyl dehydratase
MTTVDARETRFGGYLDDFTVGDVFRHWPGKTVTESENHLYCLLTLANSPIHTDAHYAQSTLPEGRNLVVGTYVYALALGMSVRDISGRATAALGVRDLRHLAPFHPGDTLYARSEVTEVRPSRSKPDQGVLTVETTGVNQADTAVIVFTRSVLLPRRPAE